MSVGAATAATAASGDWFRRATARRVAAAGLLALDRCRVCVTSRDETFDSTRLEPDPARGVRAHVVTGRLGIHIDVGIESDGGWTGFGRMRVDFGDQSGTLWTPVVGEWRVAHHYRAPGTYQLTVWLQLRDGTARFARQSLTIDGQ